MTGATGGKRAGSRRGPRRTGGGFSPALLAMALGITACVVAWGYLVVAAVDFGSSARGGDSTAWWFLALASVGAVACLFVGLMLLARVLRRLGITKAPPPRKPKREGHGHHEAPAHHSHHGRHDLHDHVADPAGPAPPAGQEEEPPHPIGGRRAAR